MGVLSAIARGLLVAQEHLHPLAPHGGDLVDALEVHLRVSPEVLQCREGHATLTPRTRRRRGHGELVEDSLPNPEQVGGRTPLRPSLRRHLHGLLEDLPGVVQVVVLLVELREPRTAGPFSDSRPSICSAL